MSGPFAELERLLAEFETLKARRDPKTALARVPLDTALRNAAPRLLAIAKAARKHVSKCSIGRTAPSFIKLRSLLNEGETK